MAKLTRKNLELAILTCDSLSPEQKIAILNIMKQPSTAEPEKPKAILFDKSEYLALAHKVLEKKDHEALASLVKIEKETGKYILPFPLKKGFWASTRKGELFDFDRAKALLEQFKKNLQALA